MKKLLIAALMVGLSSPAFAAIQNVKVSGDIITSWVNDTNMDLGLNSLPQVPAGQKKQNVFVTQTRLRVDADLSDNVSAQVGLINERPWNAENGTLNNDDTNVQLYLANLTLREFLYSPLTLEIGRQNFGFGNGLVLGTGGPVNFATGYLGSVYSDLSERTTYDGVTATLDYKPLTISLIYFKNGQTTNSLFGQGHLTAGQNSDVYGYNANYQLSDPWSTVIEQYTFARINGVGFDQVNGEDGNGPGYSNFAGQKGDTMYVPGLRASTNPTKSLQLQGEVAWELGKQEVAANSVNESEHRDAMLAQVMANYSLPVLEKYKPTVNASWTYASGDKNATANANGSHDSTSKTYSAWDEFNTIQGAGTIYRSIFPLSDESIIAVGASVAPLEDVTAAVTWSGIWAPASYNNNGNALVLIQPNGTSITPATNQRGNWVGNETDVNLTYNYTEDVTFGLNLGWFVPGNVFASSNHEAASQAIANVAVTF